ncbi:hypothetical protein [Morganella psychrotolerans]|uniref:Uncharacterized protein n=1 Tax=Morganella psychrotolerans TaxID=368603 RepID=A0A1B8HKW6_9GAMM|nr:hypothetical protein [Morganella psychrotolerans]OBU09883.1 hypothetical protein AYY18_18915 [Morganella psychrotolerans]
MSDGQKLVIQLLQRLNFNAQDVGMISLRNKVIGDPLQVTCAALWTEVCNATEISQSLINRLTIFHDNVESAAKKVGMYQ